MGKQVSLQQKSKLSYYTTRSKTFESTGVGVYGYDTRKRLSFSLG
jgi:hypothetical protein